MSNHIKRYLESNLAHMCGNRDTWMKMLKDNYCSSFPQVGECLYTVSFKIAEYARLLNQMETDSDEINVDILNYKVHHYNDFLKKSYNVRESSTSALHREASVFKYQEILNLVSEFESLASTYYKDI